MNNMFYQLMLHGSSASRFFPLVYSARDFQKVASIPALLLVGDHERIYGSNDTLPIARQVYPGIETELIPEAHHITALSNPLAVNRRILAFLEQHSSR